MKKDLKFSRLTLIFGVAFVLGGAFQNCGGMNVSSLPSMMPPIQSLPQPVSTPVGLSPAPDDGDSNIHSLNSIGNATTFSYQIMNKHLLASRLEFVFGAEITRLSPGVGVPMTIESILNLNPIYFGSMCNTYESVWMRNTAGTPVRSNSPFFSCSTITQSNLPLEPPLGTIREAIMDKICARAVNTSVPVHFAIRQTDSRATPLFFPSIDDEVTPGGPVNTSRNFALYKAFRLFYPTQPDPRVTAPNLLESYRSFFVDPSRPQLGEWQTALYSLCISPYWRIL
jgi:hypothetical protein